MASTARRRAASGAAALVGLALFGACALYGRARALPAASLAASLVTDDASTVVDDAPGAVDDAGAEGGADDEAPAAASEDRPDIVMVLLDDVGTNDLWDSADLPALPELAALKSNGVLLGGYYGQSYCSPARATMLTGKFAHRIGFSDQAGGKRELTAYSNFSVPLGHELLPETMKRLGYGTHGIGKWNIGHCNEAYVPWQRGFDS